MHNEIPCILSAIIVVALKNILTQPKKLPYLWNTYKPDFLLTKTQIDKTQSDYLLSSIKAIRVLGSLNFSSAENFTNRIYKTINNMMLDEDFNYVNNNVLSHHNGINDKIQDGYHNHCQLNEASVNTKDSKNNIYELSKILNERNGTKSDDNYVLRNSNVVSKSSDVSNCLQMFF
ncbi:unnamed protein product [Schistosoma curassoni]|uniref:Cyclin N-terminal domain-containing protein n=1 Tax=Schistosoma curassoni TaxID=6186 RepID=A0A183KNP2_9TREM|nr:unnamed protein product [Schistosoma curassoni]